MEKVLIASPVNQHPMILEQFAVSLLNLDTREVNPSFLFIDDNPQKESSAILLRLARQLRGEIHSGMSPPDDYRGEVKHRWTSGRIFKVANFRNSILTYARENNFDALLMVDSDLMLHPRTLSHLMEQQKDIISEIYWTSWIPGGQPFPQVWLWDNYTQYTPDDEAIPNLKTMNQRIKVFHDQLHQPGIYKVGGLGGCTLMGRAVLESPVSFSKVPNLSFLGEDRHFCVRASVYGFELFVDTCYPAVHLYRLSELPQWEDIKKSWCYTVSLMK